MSIIAEGAAFGSAEQRSAATAGTIATERTRQATAALDASDTWTRESRTHALANAERAAEAEQAAYEPEAG